ncbi:MAG: hypothetical protein KatS3mg023_3590 [Armatimonadota bacterium]|nr:MAG: hypothetical protein KatS3mg023_3590 [Armatimonadota bacterium]
MRLNVHHLSDVLDERAVKVLFQGHAELKDGYLEFKDCMSDFVVHRIALLDTQIRLIQADDGLQMKLLVPAHDLYLELFIPYVMEEEHAIHEAVRQLRRSGRYQEADRLETIVPELLWYLDAKRYLDSLRRLRNVMEFVEEMEMRLSPHTLCQY